MKGLKPPGKLSFDGNIVENWRKWKKPFQNYLLAENLIMLPKWGDSSDSPENVVISQRQVTIILHCAGEKAQEVFSQFETEKSADDLEDVLAKFEAHCNPSKNIL